eukprot:CAMPEP_0176364994 /NCGR_PEP_ID=MMETSP0126-20121128/20162_1 /TAXON_ID=141414 ORGANISM="Strombidinopsis acuminatum, Strain SPMC142" /NCGR_SAMPLE_ID=MMETSP0126 /ASSEMBLY_ACC=CAM_ASM_000229 /LENGTH=39 /DNA_ID= /DNA_START= /DNA_END= /DNA_ORIENTATION=
MSENRVVRTCTLNSKSNGWDCMEDFMNRVLEPTSDYSSK